MAQSQRENKHGAWFFARSKFVAAGADDSSQEGVVKLPSPSDCLQLLRRGQDMD
ncbi:hypothetical protein COLO4_30136 [Corchorus olitorius]|uniref:Uncharacterized protein n=1 Tax=Corchorus olitorius TaxID=93759 RepID=A0A1R3HAV2_9ROSI|nr:hypothetical protein COLO4_30136 [Corchorus olitorius]